MSWWPGDKNGNDIVGGNNASIQNLLSYAPGKVQEGFTLASYGYARTADAPSLKNQRFTIAAWARPDGSGLENDRNGSVIINQVTDGSNFTQLSWSATSQAFVFSFGNSQTEFLVSRDSFPAGKFYFVAGTYDGTAFKLYVNGALEGTLAESRAVAYSSTGWQIGGNQNSNMFARTWVGIIDEVQIFNRALSQTELQSISDVGSAGECKSVSIAPGGVVSAQAFGGLPAIAPGSWIEIFGGALAATTRGWAGADFTGITAPTSLDGTKVTIGGKSAFIDYVSPGQINAFVPSDAPTGPQQLIVTAGGVAGTPYNVTVNALQPGLLAPSSFAIGGSNTR